VGKKAVCDWPAVSFSEELIEAYPEAKVILTTREVNSWHASVLKTIYWYANDPQMKLVSKIDWSANLIYALGGKMLHTFFDGDFPNRGKTVYHEHCDKIRKLVPRENLLEYHVQEGWGPLCEFLGRAEPAEDFPNVNDASSFVIQARMASMRQLGNGLFRYLVLASGAWIIWSMARFFFTK
jgi:hypothetical protein